MECVPQDGAQQRGRRWLPFRVRLPLPGLGALGNALPARRRRAAARAKAAAGRSHFASATVTIANGRVVGGGGGALGTGAGNSSATARRVLATASLTAALPPLAISGSRSGGGGVNGGGCCRHAPASAPAAPAPAAVAQVTAAKPATRPASDGLAGALARAASQSIIHPLDTLKVRLQANMPPAAGAAAAAATQSVSKFGRLVPPAGSQLHAAGAGLASLYKGVVGAASGAGIAIGAYFAFYSAACNVLTTQTTLAPSAVAFVGGAVAAAGSSVVKVPLAVCIRSVQAGVYPNVFAACGAITTAAGPRGLFTGYWPTLLEDVPDMACKFAAYESMRQLHRRLVGGRDASPGEDFAMGALAGAAAAAATTPLDVVKTRMMCAAASRPTMSGAAAAVLASGGPGAFFAGVGARAVSNGINSAVFFCAFEAIRGAFQKKAAAAAAEKQAAARGAEALVFEEEGDAGAARGRGMVLKTVPLRVSEGDHQVVASFSVGALPGGASGGASD
jgi:hypothetical protein